MSAAVAPTDNTSLEKYYASKIGELSEVIHDLIAMNLNFVFVLPIRTDDNQLGQTCIL